MLVGVPKEIKNNEFRVGLTPAGVRELVRRGHAVAVERNAGGGAGFGDADYAEAGARLAGSAEDIYAHADLLVKVKEPQPQECRLLRPGQALFTYLHLAPDPVQVQALLASGCVAIAYETVTSPGGGLPLLAPMSQVAGRMSIQAGAAWLEKPRGGAGVLLGGVPGVAPGRVAILGGGTVGLHAAQMAVGLGADTIILDRSPERLAYLATLFGSRLRTAIATPEAVEEHALAADLVVGAALVPGAAAPKLLTREQIARMRAGSVVVDVAIDQGGCFETSRPTTHAEPTFVVDGVIHYCVANMPGAVPRTSTFALTNATLPYVLALAEKGWRQALLDDEHLRAGLNIDRGELVCAPVAQALGLSFMPATASLGR